MKLKLLMKKLYSLESALSWKESIPDENREEWIAVMSEALIEGVLPFPRSTRPVNSTGQKPMVVGFGDGALAGFGGSVYSQWPVTCRHDSICDGIGDFEANLCMSKGRVCPMRGYTVPRTELCGALLVSRLLLSVVTALCTLEEAPSSVVMILDSRCIISSLEMNSSKVLPFFQNRLCECTYSQITSLRQQKLFLSNIYKKLILTNPC